MLQKYMNARGMKILGALDEAARGCNATPAQVSLAWLMTRPGVTAPIASATNVDQLQEILRAATLKLDAEAIKALDEASA
jgi:aryl-alcohol dehydrogenase-like predicted oxidoreductase